MKQKFFFKGVFLALSAVALFSCNDDDNKGEVPGETTSLIKTRAEAEALSNSAYVPLQWVSSIYTFFAEGATEVSVAIADETSGESKLSKFDPDPENAIAVELFNAPYTGIGSANLAIEQIGEAEVNNDLTQEDKDHQIARAKFLRGYNYFKLVQVFGELPLILTSESTVTERSSIDEVYTQIVKDLTEASEYLPAYDPAKSTATQAAVNTILAKVYLTWGQHPLSYTEVQTIAESRQDPAKPAPDRQKLEQAITYADEVINSGNYRLLDDYNAIWGVPNENNDEVIFSVRHDGDDVDSFGNHQTHCGYTWPKEPTKDPHINYTDISFENRIPDNNDSRKALSYLTRLEFEDGAVDVLTWPVSVVRAGKWIHYTTDGTFRALNNQPNDIDHIDYRYAEVLLIKAEALFFLGRTAEALSLVNDIRKRAYGVHYEHGGKLTTLTENDLYNEWDYEFAFEQKHWYNLVRWRNYLATVENAIAGFEYYKDEYASAATINAAFPGVSDINAPLYARLHAYQHAKYNNLKGRLYRLPIPVGYSGEDLRITPQNPGY